MFQYIVQGNLNDNRRNMNLLIKILDEEYDKNFKINNRKGELPICLREYRDKIDFAGILILLIFIKVSELLLYFTPYLKETQPEYYDSKLTSTINYI